MTVEPRCWGGGGGVSHPLQLTTGLVINSSVTTSPTLAGEHMLLIPKVSILSEQMTHFNCLCSFLSGSDAPNRTVGPGETNINIVKMGHIYDRF